MYELLVGTTPFQDDNQREIFRKITNAKKYLKFPRGMDKEAEDLITRLLTAKPEYRLGNLNGGVDDIKNHPWFAKRKGFWSALESREIQAPFVPPIKDPLDTSVGVLFL